MRTAIPLTVLATALACSLATAPANARARVFVASYGNDANPCTFGSPCKTFQVAVNAVDAGGEVTAIDSAGFGPINIAKAVTITSPNGVEAGVVGAAGADAIDINAGPTDAVVIRGLTLNGAGSANYGILFNTGLHLTVTDCVVQNFMFDGIGMQPTTNMSFTITYTKALNNGGGGIVYFPVTDGSNTASGIIDHVEVSNNVTGFNFDTNFHGGGDVNVAISNSIVFNNQSDGIYLANRAHGMYVSIDNTTITQNGIVGNTVTGGISANFTAKVLLRRSMITENKYGLDNETSSNSVYSYQDNSINDNQFDFNGPAPLSVALR
jgi:hypothetical protein